MEKKTEHPSNVSQSQRCNDSCCESAKEREKTRSSVSVIHINTWEDFKQTAAEIQLKFVAFARQIAPLSKLPLGLRLIFIGSNYQYVFLDVKCSAFKRTKLSVQTTRNGQAYIDEEPVEELCPDRTHPKRLKRNLDGSIRLVTKGKPPARD